MKSNLFSILILMVLFVACKKDKTEPIEPYKVLDNRLPEEVIADIATKLENADSISTFVQALTGLQLSKEDTQDGLTVFAPLNETVSGGSGGIASAPRNNKVMSVSKTSNTTQQNQVADSTLRNHIIKGIHRLGDLTEGKILSSLNGKQLKVTRAQDSVWINGIFIGGQEIISSSTQVIYTVKSTFDGTSTNDAAIVPTALEIHVFDATKWAVDKPKGEVVPLADVSLFRSYEDYADSIVAFHQKTGVDGRVHFINIPAGTYYVGVSLGEKSNIVHRSPQPINSRYTGHAISGIFQSQEEIDNAPNQPAAAVGNFRLRDINGDGIINENDRVPLPYETGTVVDGTFRTIEVLIGLDTNVHNGTNTTQFKNDLKAINDDFLSPWHKQLAVLDAALADDVLTDTIPAFASSFNGIGNFTFNAGHQTIANVWNNGYQIIEKLNELESLAPTSGAQDLMGELAVLRAYTYFQLLEYFGPIPLMQTASQKSNPVRSNRAGIVSFIQAELQGAVNKLSNQTSEKYRPNVATANALLARLALSEKNYATARDLTSTIIQSGQYSLAATNSIYTGTTEIVWDNSANMTTAIRNYFYGRQSLPYLRMTEVYLVNVEANLGLGNTQQAIASFNLLLQRRNLPSVTTLSWSDFQARYQAEMRREGVAFHALLRWGTAVERLGYKGFSAPKNELLPIPLSVINQHGTFMQNPGY